MLERHQGVHSNHITVRMKQMSRNYSEAVEYFNMITDDDFLNDPHDLTYSDCSDLSIPIQNLYGYCFGTFGLSEVVFKGQ